MLFQKQNQKAERPKTGVWHTLSLGVGSTNSDLSVRQS